LVLPGSMRTCSQPTSKKMGHRRSANNGAANNKTSGVRWAYFLAAKPTAKCPMNMWGVNQSADDRIHGTIMSE